LGPHARDFPLASSISLAVLDLAGTTLDDRVDGVSVVAGAMTEAFAREGIALPAEAFAAERGRRKADAVGRLIEKLGGSASWTGAGEPGHAEPAARDGELNSLAARIYQTFLHELEQRLPLVSEIPGATDTMRLLRARGVRVALGSGFPSEIVDALLGRLGWERSGLVDYVIPEDLGGSRPEPAGIVAAMRRLGVVDPRKVVKVGDTVVDVEEGRNAGVWTVGVLTGAGSRDQLEAAGADRVVESIRALPGLLI
jgi:phosphonatase-like hydrolase